MTLQEFYDKHKGKTNLKIANMEAIEDYLRYNEKSKYITMLDILKELKFINLDEYIDLFSLLLEKEVK